MPAQLEYIDLSDNFNSEVYAARKGTKNSKIAARGKINFDYRSFVIDAVDLLQTNITWPPTHQKRFNKIFVHAQPNSQDASL